MNKSDVIQQIAEKTGLSKTQAAEALAAFFDSVKTAVKDNKSVRFIGFGTFASGVRKKRKGINPHTKEEIVIPSRRYPKFRPGKEFKDYLN